MQDMTMTYKVPLVTVKQSFSTNCGACPARRGPLADG